MTYRTATATVAELAPVARLLDDYVRQHLNMAAWPGSLDTFKRDYASGCFNMIVLYRQETIVGFAAWTRSYDLHHCVHGALLLDMYIAPAYRCQGLGAALICAIAAEITRLGWTYMRGQALSGPAARLYGRVGIRFGANEYNVSGQALRQLASLVGQPARDILRGLPTQAMNHQP